jgi:uncharacterized protein (DUF1684 family)
MMTIQKSNPIQQVSALDEFRTEKDEFMRADPQSPLDRRQRRAFKGLSYFAENPELRFELEPELIPGEQKMRMQTSTGDVREFTRFAYLNFSVDGQDVRLTLYRDEDGLFLPFADALAGSETYGAGRYLEPEPLGNGKVSLDFNLAYNPYCAYNDGYSCPITPAENRLKVPIRAGEKVFPGGHSG